ncbi:STP1 protein [Plasmodium ovale wallikeri]|nr:STP1 protein [Plasmodium ovale wallikeri]
MANDSGYSIHTHYIPIDAFTSTITNDIKNLIRKYGHKNCGLKHEELCTELKKFINQKKTLELSVMDEKGKTKWNSEWSSKRNEFLNRLYDEEGFINMCFPKTYQNNQRLNKLLSKHIDFCKKKDEWKAQVEANHEYSACRAYDSWIEREKASFTNEYLENVRNFRRSNVDKYFSTKEHPGGHDPRRTYNKSKLDCEIYNPASKKYIQKPVEQASKNEPQLPSVSNIRKGSQGKDGKSAQDGDTATAKTKPDVKNLSQTESSPDSPTSPLINTKVDITANSQDISLQPKAPNFSVNRDGGTKELTPKQGESPTNIPRTALDGDPPQAGSLPPLQKDTKLTPAIQSAPAPNATTSLSSSHSTVHDTTSSKTRVTSSILTVTPDSSLDSVSPSPSDPLLPVVVTKDQDTPPHSTTTPVTSAYIHSTETLPAPAVAVSSLVQPQPPVEDTPPSITAAQIPGTLVSSSASTFTTTDTTTISAPAAVTTTTMSTTHASISSPKEATSASSSQELPPPLAASEPKATAPTTSSQQTVIHEPTSLSGSDIVGVSAPTQPDGDPAAKSAGDVSPKSKVPIKASEHSSIKSVMITDNTLQKISHHTNQLYKQTVIQNPPIISFISPASNKSDASVNISKGGSTVRNNKNDNSNTEPEDLSSLINIIPIILIILTSFTALFLLYKYTPFGFLLGRRKKRKKRDLRRTFVIPEESTYESPNIALHEWEDPNLAGKAVENDVYIKLLKINRYKQEMQKRKKKNKKTLIEVHIEVLEEHKNDEWELHKGDFLEICLRGFINDENDFYSNFPNSKLTINSINEKTIEDIQKQEILWNNWIENHRNILEQWKKEDWFQNLKNEWKNEEQMYKEKNDKSQKNISNEQDTHSIVSQKEIWKQWISKQATLIKMLNQEDWFKELVDEQNKEKNNYHINEYNNISVTSKIGLKNKKTNHEEGRSKNIIQKLMVQIHMMVLEECIKEDIIRNKE